MSMLDAMTSAATEFAKARERIDSLRQQWETAKVDFASATRLHSDWQSQWDTAMVAIDADGTLSPSQAKATLDTIDRLIQDIDQAEQLAARWRTEHDQMEAFDDEVRGLVESLDLQFDNASTTQIVSDLHDRLKTARDEKTSRDHWNAQVESLAKKQRASAATIQTQTKLLDQLCREAGCESAGDLPSVEQRSAQRVAVEQTIAEKESELRGLAQATALEDFIEQAAAEDADTLMPRIEQLTLQLTALDAERTKVTESAVRLKDRLDEIDGSNEAALANEVAEEAVARARTLSENYVRVKLGSAMLRRAVVQYRKQNQGPVLRRAGELFSRLTIAAFSGLDTHDNDDGTSVLVGMRADGASTVGVGEMSEGTCDQLFLALRLASLEVYLENNPPIPFIVDDILSNFDNDRAAATMAVLGELSAKTQIIMFTHHQHLIDVARSVLTDDVLFTTSIGGDLPPLPTGRAKSDPARPKKKPKTAKIEAAELF